jgi:hypothetical protein
MEETEQIFMRGQLVKVSNSSHPSYLKNRTYWVKGHSRGLVEISSLDDDYDTSILSEDISPLYA